MTEFCLVCNKNEPHGYIRGSGIYLEHTCLKCFRKIMDKDNYIEGGDSKNRSKAPSLSKKEDT